MQLMSDPHALLASPKPFFFFDSTQMNKESLNLRKIFYDYEPKKMLLKLKNCFLNFKDLVFLLQWNDSFW